MVEFQQCVQAQKCKLNEKNLIHLCINCSKLRSKLFEFDSSAPLASKMQIMQNVRLFFWWIYCMDFRNPTCFGCLIGGSTKKRLESGLNHSFALLQKATGNPQVIFLPLAIV